MEGVHRDHFLLLSVAKKAQQHTAFSLRHTAHWARGYLEAWGTTYQSNAASLEQHPPQHSPLQ
ncbi:hypothetical protein VTI28DRAFT_9294 [Corynascus sepedonium]